MKPKTPAPTPSRPSATTLRHGRRTAGVAPTEEQRKSARVVAIAEGDAGSAASIARALPDPSSLDPGTLVIVPREIAGAQSFARSVLAVFGRAKTIERALRCTALVSRGYVDVGAADEEDRRSDLAFGFSPSSS